MVSEGSQDQGLEGVGNKGERLGLRWNSRRAYGSPPYQRGQERPEEGVSYLLCNWQPFGEFILGAEQ